jgi:hypothetical protein
MPRDAALGTTYPPRLPPALSQLSVLTSLQLWNYSPRRDDPAPGMLACLAALTRLRQLSFRSGSVKGEDLAALSGLSQLQVLSVPADCVVSHVTGLASGLAPLQHLPALQVR